ncbi:MAG: hypothetical protein LBH97_00505 [Treponema sp.]|jgi:hypothetical protein|nr:hypothetical protein [Treponema sp.]
MKKILICLLIVATLAVLSCRTAPVEAGSVVGAEIAMKTFDDNLREVYNTYQPLLDMSGSQDYTVAKGDTLSKITRLYYGDLLNVGEAGSRNGFYFPIIILASPDCQIADPDLIETGIVLKIIDLERNLANPVAHQAIKDSLIDIASIYHAKNKPAEEAGLIKLSNSL